MHKDKPVIYLAAHGAVSGQGKVVDIGKYCVILPSKRGDKICLTAHNMLVQQLTQCDDAGMIVLKDLEDLPSTTSVSKRHKPADKRERECDLNDHDQRKKMRLDLEKAEKAATDSQYSWDLLEHKLAPVYDLMESRKMLIPKAPYVSASLTTKATDSDPTSTTLRVYIDQKKMFEQISSLLGKLEKGELMPDKVKSNDSGKKTWLVKSEIDKEHVMYMTPYENTKKTKVLDRAEFFEKVCLNLSDVLKNYLPKMHFVFKDLLPPPSTMIAKHQVVEEELLEADDEYKPFREVSADESFIPGEMIWCDMTISDEANIILGACRDVHPDF